jgi:hypothetical protein
LIVILKVNIFYLAPNFPLAMAVEPVKNFAHKRGREPKVTPEDSSGK